MPGSGQIHLTGQMGNIMKESVAAAFTYVRARAAELGLPEDFLTKVDVHVHLPAGAVPKDGAASGITIVTAIASMLHAPEVSATGRRDERRNHAPRGSMLRVTGIKEKLPRGPSQRHSAPWCFPKPQRSRTSTTCRDADSRTTWTVHLVSRKVEDVAGRSSSKATPWRRRRPRSDRGPAMSTCEENGSPGSCPVAASERTALAASLLVGLGLATSRLLGVQGAEIGARAGPVAPALLRGAAERRTALFAEVSSYAGRGTGRAETRAGSRSAISWGMPDGGGARA